MKTTRLNMAEAGLWILALAWILAPLSMEAAPCTWTGGGADSNWFNSANWNPVAVPATGDSVMISNANAVVVLSNSTAFLDTIVISNTATLLFANYDTNTTIALLATNVLVLNAAKITHNANTATTTNYLGQWVPDARIYVVCTNLTVAAGGQIVADAKGYGWTNKNTTGRGPGGGAPNAGGGHGGAGGNGGGATNDSTLTPFHPGSSGGGAPNDGGYAGGRGGGLIWIQASSTITVNGAVSANGENGGYWAGGGAGGGIYITSTLLAGDATGLISANGGAGGAGGMGGGGGGRVALLYDESAQTAATQPAFRFSVSGGVGGTDRNGRPGTLSLPSTNFFPRPSLAGGELVIPGFSAWSVSSLTVTGGVAVFPASFQLAVAGDALLLSQGGVEVLSGTLSVGGNLIATNGYLNVLSASNAVATASCAGNLLLSGGRMNIYGNDTNSTTLTVSGGLRLTNSGALYIYSGSSNAPNYGALVDVKGDIMVATNSTVYFMSHGTKGGSGLLKAANFTLSGGGRIKADAYGFSGGSNAPGKGPGAGPGSCGGGYGGRGGPTNTIGGATYGSSNAPAEAGSGGGGAPANGGTWGGNGGGSIRVIATRTARIDGTITANGDIGTYNGGGGAGGGIYIYCRDLVGAVSATLQANGAAGNNSSGGGGGGGRIAIWRLNNAYNGTNTTANGGIGSGGNGAPGTIVWGQLKPPGSVIQLR